MNHWTGQLAIPRSERQRACVPFVAVGAACVVGGGLLAAVTAHAPTRHATWAVAYLVLIAGAAQILLGTGQGWLATPVPALGVRIVELVAWNLGSAAVVAGAIGELPYVTDVGGLLIIVAVSLLFTVTLFSFETRREWNIRTPRRR